MEIKQKIKQSHQMLPTSNGFFKGYIYPPIVQAYFTFFFLLFQQICTFLLNLDKFSKFQIVLTQTLFPENAIPNLNIFLIPSLFISESYSIL